MGARLLKTCSSINIIKKNILLLIFNVLVGEPLTIYSIFHGFPENMQFITKLFEMLKFIVETPPYEYIALKDPPKSVAFAFKLIVLLEITFVNDPVGFGLNPWL